MKKILLSTDFSPAARKACEYAVQLFKDEPVKYILVNSFEIPASTSEMLISIVDVLSQNSEEGLMREKNHLISLFPDKVNDIDIHSENGYLDNVLRSFIDMGDISLVVMGTTGASVFRKFFLGSHTSSVLHNVNCPILVVPAGSKIKRPYRLALALDSDTAPSRNILAPLKEILDQFHCSLRPVHINTQRIHMKPMHEGNLAVQEEVYSKVLGYPVINMRSESVAEGLQNFISEYNIDLLSMIHHQRSFITDFFHNSKSREMAMLSEIPLLVLNDCDITSS